MQDLAQMHSVIHTQNHCSAIVQIYLSHLLRTWSMRTFFFLICYRQLREICNKSFGDCLSLLFTDQIPFLTPSQQCQTTLNYFSDVARKGH